MQKSYPQIKYKRYFCVPACIKAILVCKGLGRKIDIWTIGNELDLKVPKWLSGEYLNTKISKNNNFEINLHKKEFSINHFFKKYNLHLEEKHIYRTNKEKIIELLKNFKNSDIILCFDYPTIAKIPDQKWGHVSLVGGFNEKSIFIQDPKSKNKLEINYGLLIKSIKKHGRKKRAGFWIISKSKTKDLK